MKLSDLPSAMVPPAGPYEASAVRPAASRRKVLRNALLISSGVALGVLDLIPLTRPRRANAAYTVWSDGCHGYHDNTTVCYPPNAYYGSDNCDGTWHRAQSNTWLNSCVKATYTHDSTSCSTRNAWYWYAGSNYTKCSDGFKTSYDYCNNVSAINSFSICRTYH